LNDWTLLAEAVSMALSGIACHGVVSSYLHHGVLLMVNQEIEGDLVGLLLSRSHKASLALAFRSPANSLLVAVIAPVLKSASVRQENLGQRTKQLA